MTKKMTNGDRKIDAGRKRSECEEKEWAHLKSDPAHSSVQHNVGLEPVVQEAH